MMQATIRIKGFDQIEHMGFSRRATLYRGRDRAGKQEAVFKVLLPHLVENLSFIQRFKRDVRKAAQVNHPNLVNVLQFGRADDTYFVAYEYYDGVGLDTILSDHPRIPVDIALSIVLDLARGLEACSVHRVLHRDVCPGNIVLTRRGHAKLANLALAVDFAKDGRVQFAGRVSSTISYMSPEQLRGDKLGLHSDMFSLGAVMWELLCGRPAFGTANYEEIADGIQTVTLQNVADINPMVEPAFGEIIKCMMEKERNNRYDAFEDLIKTLEGAILSYGHQCDPNALTRLVADSSEYTDWYTKNKVQELREKVESARQSGPGAMIRLYEKLVYLQPTNKETREELERLKNAETFAERTGKPNDIDLTDPGMRYRVVLESLDARETESSFALKLSTKLRMPVFAIKAFVADLPASLPGEHVHRKAVYLAKIMEELGAITRLEVIEKEKPTVQQCPECNTQVDVNAEFCFFCQHQLVSFVELSPGLDGPEESPFDDDEDVPVLASTAGNRWQKLPKEVKLLGALGAVFVIVLLVVILS